MPLAWFPRLLNAPAASRQQVELSYSGLHWPALDEDIGIDGLLAGNSDHTAPLAAPLCLNPAETG